MTDREYATLQMIYTLGMDVYLPINNDCLRAIKRHRLSSNRIDELREKGYTVKRVPMGSGGVGQIKQLKNEFRFQITYGTGRYNYAYAVIVSKP